MKLSSKAEKQYIATIPISHRKQFGQFFTPEPIAAVLRQWIIAASPTEVVDPAVGTGRLLSGFPNEMKLIGYDIDSTILEQTALMLDDGKSVQFKQEDFLVSGWEESYQGIICNPPYIKFKSYPNKADYFRLFKEYMGLSLSGFTNIYVLFLLKALHQLKASGRAAFIVPTEFLNAEYGEPVRNLLAEKGNLAAAAVTDFTFSWFDQAATTSTLLFIDNHHAGKDTAFYRLEKEEDLAALQRELAGETFTLPKKEVSVSTLAGCRRWQEFYRDKEDFSSYALKPLSSFATVNRGIATGANRFFCLNNQQQKAWELNSDYFLPCLSRANQIKTPFFDQHDWRKLYHDGEAVLLLHADQETDKDQALTTYLAHGEWTKINERYLTQRRRPWYKQEIRKPAPILVKVLFRDDPLFIRNRSAAVNLTAFHCIYLLPEYEQDTDVLMAFLLTKLARRIFSGQHKQYGKGLKKFEPSDLKRAPVVDLDQLTAVEKKQIITLYQETQAAFYENKTLDSSALDHYFEQVLTKTLPSH